MITSREVTPRENFHAAFCHMVRIPTPRARPPRVMMLKVYPMA
jgi:hypothetical protein